ncbi:MAG: response regulator [Oscillospiraceae bacterium]|nr:response regulator [Oscillospiraceae bacterium]
MKKKNETTRFLTVSLILLSLLCIIIFSFLAFIMNQKSSETINEVGSIYMTGMSQEISIHFETTIGLQLSQVESLVQTAPPGSASTADIHEKLQYNAQARGFEYLALCATDGSMEMIYGSPVTLSDPPAFLNSVNNGEKKVAAASDVEGNLVTLLGISANYPMASGKECTALVAGLPNSYIQKTLFLDEDNALVYSHIIRKNGSFVIRSGGAFRENYFDRIRATFDDIKGEEAERYVSELAAAMEANEDYSAILQTGSGRRHLYCTKLAYSEWYLITVMPYGSLDESVSELSVFLVRTIFAGCAVILLVLLYIFFRYFNLTRQQVKDLKAAQEEAIHANKAKSEFLSNMSHDIRTPMNAIVGMTAIATANINNPQQVQNCLRKITLSSKHLLGLINDVLDMSKIESGKMTLNVDQVSLREVMDSIVSIVQPQVKAKHQQFNVSIYDISTENVCCDSVRLNQVLLNFLSNAIKFTPEGGTIQMSLHEEESPKGEDYIRIHLQVKDNGIGMSEEFKAKVFDSFAREDSMRVHRTEGTGLGMAITKYIVDTMGGSIDVKSEQGKGTEFNVTLDLERAVVQEVDMILPSWNMLVVDDDQQLCETTVSALESIGINAEWSLSGETAVEMVEKRHRQHDDYHIILLDWKLPGMDGIATAKEIRKRMGDNIPILLISAYDWSDIEHNARQAGVNGFISKPLFKSTLFYSLKHYMDGDGEKHPRKEEKQTDFHGKKILLAEDNDLNWEIAEELLSDLGLDLERAENGQICVDMFQKSPVGYYAGVLMDIRMPVMTGYDAAIAIRKLDRADANLPIIAMTADAFSDDIKHCLDCGMNAHVAKPIDIHEVARQLERYLNH